MDRCQYGRVPEDCADALGIYIDGIRWDEDGTEHPYREWRPVCVDRPGVCPHVTEGD